MSADVFSHLSPAIFQKPRRKDLSTSTWKGHIPFAFWCIERFRPKVFVELGTYIGDSYFAFCQAVEAYKTGTQCFAVDTWVGDSHLGAYGGEIFDYVNAYNREHYSSFSRLLRMTFDEALAQFEDNSIDLLHIDGLHTYDAVRHDFETWLPKLSQRGVVLFHDSNIFNKDFGVWRLMRELEPRFPHFHFLHSCGLSMFTMTDEAPADARWMTTLSPADAKIWRSIFWLAHATRALPAKVLKRRD